MKIAHRTEPYSMDWTHFCYKVFDAPTYSGVYQDRYNYLCTLISPLLYI